MSDAKDDGGKNKIELADVAIPADTEEAEEMAREEALRLEQVQLKEQEGELHPAEGDVAKGGEYAE